VVGALAARVARRLARRSPPVEVDLRRAGWGAATADLAQGAASAAFMTTPFPAGLATTTRFHAPITHLAVPAGSPLATAALVRLEQLARVEVLLPRIRPAGSVWAQLATRLPIVSAAADLDDLPAALDLVAAGRGPMPVPQLLVETVRRPDVRFVPLDAAGLRMTYGLVWPAEAVTAEVMALVQAAREVLRVP
jgi:hypothetical protein